MFLLPYLSWLQLLYPYLQGERTVIYMSYFQHWRGGVKSEFLPITVVLYLCIHLSLYIHGSLVLFPEVSLYRE